MELPLLLFSIFVVKLSDVDDGVVYVFVEILTVYGCTLSLTGIVNCEESVRSYYYYNTFIIFIYIKIQNVNCNYFLFLILSIYLIYLYIYLFIH